MTLTKNDRRRLTKKIAKDGDCHLWTGSKGKLGYGYFSYKKKTYLAHRFVYEHFRGEIPEGMVIDHLCRVRHCVNTAHLELVTQMKFLTPLSMPLASGVSNSSTSTSAMSKLSSTSRVTSLPSVTSYITPPNDLLNSCCLSSCVVIVLSPSLLHFFKQFSVRVFCHHFLPVVSLDNKLHLYSVWFHT